MFGMKSDNETRMSAIMMLAAAIVFAACIIGACSHIKPHPFDPKSCAGSYWPWADSRTFTDAGPAADKP